jgi:hypothetical protein
VYRIKVKLVGNRSDSGVVIRGIVKDKVTKCALAYTKLL